MPSEISSINSDKIAMKLHTLPVKRRPVQKGIFKRLFAVTGNRKQRVAATATPDMEMEDGSSKISRALTIIFLIHIVAIGLIFVHQKFLDGRTPDEHKTVKSGKPDATVPTAATVAGVPARLDLPRMETGEKPYIVRQGDNYSRIAATTGVQETDLRLINKHVDIVPGLLLKIPPKRIIAVEPAEVTAIRELAPSDASGSLVEAVPVDESETPRARVVHPNITHATEVSHAPKAIVAPVKTTGNLIKAANAPAKTISAPVKASNTPAKATATSSGKSYVTQNGDSIWRVANRYKVSQEALMKANGITDASKLKTGMSLSIPR